MSLNNRNYFSGIFNGKKILITGDTGFKGSWLAMWLKELGANVYGFALPPKTEDDNFVKAGLKDKIHHLDGDVRDLDKLKTYFSDVQPDIAFHFAAQPLVLESYEDPVYTFQTNVIGTINFLEVVRLTGSLKAAIVVTSDKCYKNNEWLWGYRENDPMGGDDPYSASKGCAELVTNSYIKSFLTKQGTCTVASVRAGNVIGAGDWAENRIVPDFFRAIIKNEKLVLRNPYSTRPWQHVLEPLSGYLYLAVKLYTGEKNFSGGWNFGPSGGTNRTVVELIDEIIKTFNKGEYISDSTPYKPHEAKMLNLDISKANWFLKWKPVLSFEETVKFTIDGYAADLYGDDIYEERKSQIELYSGLALERNIEWALSNEFAGVF